MTEAKDILESMSAESLVRNLKSFLSRRRVSPGVILVACSGGPDSIALLHALGSLSPAIGVKILAGHLNHGLRGEESDADEAFVEQVGSAWQIPVRSERIDVQNLVDQGGGNLEAVARRVRYAWLADLASKVGATWVATGHTADDQAETVLHNLLRGGGLRGLRGIAARRRLGAGITLIRPILSCSRSDVLAYLKAHGLTARIDSSNADARFMRNRIRMTVLPMLRAQFGRQIDRQLVTVADQAREMIAMQDRLATRLLERAERPRAGGIIILDASTLAGQPRHLLRAAFHLLWKREGWAVATMPHAHWDRLADLATATVTQVLHLPDKVRVRRRGRVIQLWREPDGEVAEGGIK